MIVAKPIIPNQYWILRNKDQKVGNIQADQGGYCIRINNSVKHFKSLELLKKHVSLSFDSRLSATNDKNNFEVHGFPTSSEVNNGIWDVKRQIPIWTKEPRSRSWMAAGWYMVKQHRDWKLHYCPKVILLDRYKYRGPFKTQDEALK